MKKKIVYMGTPEYARVILQKLLDTEDFEVILVLTQPDRPVGRKQVLTPSAVKVLSLEYGIEVLQPQRLSDEGIFEKIKEANPDFIIVAAFGQLLPRSILDIAPCINLHASILPKHRGASPIQNALLQADSFTGITAMLMEEGLDSGPILGYSSFRIPTDMRLQGLFDQLSADASLLILDILRRYDLLLPIPQNRAVSTHCKKIAKSDGAIGFDNAAEIYCKFRAFEGWPGIFTSEGLKILDMRLAESKEQHRSGEIIAINGNSIVVGCRLGSVEIFTLQPVSKKAMDAKSYLVGRGVRVGDLLI